MTDAPMARPLPSGVITFLLSDVVGSTRLWEAVPDLMPDALVRHEHLIFDAVERNRGVVLKSKGEGDSTFSVFASATDAARAALDAQRALRDERWPDACPIAVRMALHTGEAVERDRDYFGRTVNRAARLRAIAGAGEVLVTVATVELVESDLPTGTRLVELGVEQLRDLDRPETIYLLTDQPGEVRLRPTTTNPLRSLPLPMRLRSAVQQPLVGRKDELYQLEIAWARAAEGHPGVVILQGEAGIGKSRVAGELASRVHEGGNIVLAGRCDDLSGSPFQPFAEAFRFVAERVRLEALPEMPAAHLGALGRLAPDLVASPETLAATDVPHERERLFFAMNTLLERINREAPVLFVLEDLHWATETTIDMLRSLLMDAGAGRVLVVATSRPISGVDSPVRHLVADAHQFAFSLDQIELQGLSSDETGDLLATAERAIGTTAAAEIHALTNGNPLFALAVATSVIDRTDTSPVGSAPLELPDSVQAIIDRQLGRLEGASLSFLQAAAVLGITFEVDLAAELAEASFDDVEETLDVGERRLIVREQSAGVLHLYEFNHALVAAALVGQLSAIRRRRLHAGAARILSTAALIEGDRVSRVAHHAAQAGSALMPLESITAFREAAWQARERMAVHEAIHWLELAQRLLDAVDDTRLRIQVDIELGAAAHAAGWADAGARLHETAERSLRLGDAELLASALIAADNSGASDYLRTNPARIALLEAALDMLPAGDGADRARLLVMLAGELIFAEDGGRRFPLADDALAMARRLDDPAVLDFVFDHRLSLLAGLAHVELRLHETGELLELLDQRRVPSYRRFSYLGSRSQVFQQLGRADEGRACLAEMRALAESEALLPRQRMFYEMVVAGWELFGGRLSAAEASIRTAFRLLKTIGVPAMGAATARQMLGVRFWQDRIDALLDSVAFGVTINPMLRAHHAYWLLQDGRVDESAKVWAGWDDTPVDGMFSIGDTGQSAVLEAAAVCAAFDGAERCRFYYSLLEPYGDRIVNPFAPDQPTHHYLGLLANALRDAELAESHFVESIALAQRVGAPLMAARSSLELARLLVDWERDPDRAVDLARTARGVGHELEAAWLVRNGDAFLDQVGGH